VEDEEHPLLASKGTVPKCLVKEGSGSHEADSPFHIVAMQKEIEASGMHQKRCGERERFANTSAKTLPKGVVPTLDMSSSTCLLTHCALLLLAEWRLERHAKNR
jgi:hypothetical protein